METLFTSLTAAKSRILKHWSNDLDEGYFTGIIVETNEVFSLCDGVVLLIEANEEYNICVTVQFSSDLYFRYLNVKDVELHEGSILAKGDKIGNCIRNELVFECLTTRKDSQWAIRVGPVTLFKRDPMYYIANEDVLTVRKQSEIEIATEPVEFTSKEMEAEFTNGAGGYDE